MSGMCIHHIHHTCIMLVTVQKSALSPPPFFFYFLLEALVFPARCIIRELLFIVLYSHTLTGINNILQIVTGNNTCKINVIKNAICMVKHAPAHKSRSHV